MNRDTQAETGDEEHTGADRFISRGGVSPLRTC